MKIVTTVQEMQQITSELRASGKSIGFVPTMGYLHEGHATLLRKAREENEIVVLSVFVNPLQFGPNEDLDRYPRDIDRDENVAKENGVDYLFYPSVEEMYPARTNNNSRSCEAHGRIMRSTKTWSFLRCCNCTDETI